MEVILSKIQNIIQDLISSEERLKDAFLVDLKIKDKKIEVFIDADGPVSYDKFRTISRGIEEYLDESLVIGEIYTLDVSSPGADAPLKFLRQYEKHIGRKIKATLIDGSEVEGKLILVENTTISIEKKVKKEIEIQHLDFKEIDKSFIVLAF